MTNLACPLPDFHSGEALAADRAVATSVPPSSLRQLRVERRRRMFLVQAASHSLAAIVLLVYAFAGTISFAIPVAYLLSGLAVIGIYVALSETGVNDRFDDHYLTVAQIAGHNIIQFVFVLAAPQIGYAFLCMLFLIFGFGALRMTSRQSMTTWTFTALCLLPVFLFSHEPIGLSAATLLERLSAFLCFALTIGQCAFIGLYGSSLRKTLVKRGVELKEAYERIEELAELDELTGSFNRRCIMRMLDDEIVRSRRTKAPCSIALIDLDWFKRINDVHGHPVGDEVLRSFAIAVFANIRGLDRFGRYGGEEFLLILPETPSSAASHILDRLRAIIADLDWSALSHDIAVTISAGVATLLPDETPDALLARADDALYAAKEAGRNRVANA